MPSGVGKEEEVEEVKEDKERDEQGGGLLDRCGLRNCQPISPLLTDPNPAATHPSALLLLRAGGPMPQQRSTLLRKPIININVQQRDAERRLLSAKPLDAINTSSLLWTMM